MDVKDLTQGGVLVAITIAVTQLVKNYVPARFVPLTPVIMGIVLCLLVGGFSVTAGITGLVVGLSAAGVYDHKTVVMGQ